MAHKIIILLAALVAAANAGIISSPYASPAYGLSVAKVAAAPVYAAPVAKFAAPAYGKVAVEEPYDAHPQYNYAYDIHDDHTGDVKSQQEWRDGDVVKGYYSLIEPDGTKRTVEYESDPHNGFNAVVHREPGVAKVAAPLAYAAPAAYAAPVAKVVAPVYGGYHH